MDGFTFFIWIYGITWAGILIAGGIISYSSYVNKDFEVLEEIRRKK